MTEHGRSVCDFGPADMTDGVIVAERSSAA